MTREKAGGALVMTISVLEVWEMPESLQVTCKKAAGCTYLQPAGGLCMESLFQTDGIGFIFLYSRTD